MRQLALCLLASCAISTACSGAPARPDASGGPVVPEPPERSVFIRASFDDDPSDFIGRFLPKDLAPEGIDENAAMIGGRCGKFLDVKTVNASGTFEQTFNASRGVQGSLGVKPFGSVNAGHTSDTGLLVKYQLKRKMNVTAPDPDALAQCCASAPEQCSDRMIGEFWYGSGSVSQFAGRADEASGSGMYKTADASVSIKDGWAWSRVSTFEDAYFAFRVVAGPVKNTICQQRWWEEVPQSLDGMYFPATASVLAPESKAREEAMRNARRDVIRYLGERITETYKGSSSSLGGALEDTTLVEAAAQGLAERVKDRCWTPVTLRDTPEGPYTEIRVLAFLPEGELKRAQLAAVETMAETAQKQNKPAIATDLKGLAEQLKK